ncbi:hypothetical protein JCM4814A_73260 [Streptomyces phaeofaciens JCM 4814]|uniref:Uncharacterized protein n=1 Tax=Streptomyces phaeofaciens TaxID=68254 RepID=A0A918HGC8_9ACTN|nr:hypothetical protein [Streptomyces phaeofaciens]GGT62737.1 hypothetical protein GCM10010226_45720 [Streptomyces phaeofaciens]
MPRNWSRGADRIPPDALDGDFDHLKKIAKAHQRHDKERDAQASRPGRTPLSGPSSNTAGTPQKRRWGR